MKGKVSNTGYKKNSKDKNNDYNIIPTNRITMKNVDFPVLGISDKNDVRVMYPGEEHLFDGNSVLEYRMAKNGINQQDQKVDEQLKQLTDFSNNSLKIGGNIKKSNNMKDQILKIAGVKDEKEFYKKYPTQEAFMKVHGKEFKKAQMGAAVTGGSSGFKPISYSDQFDQADKMITGSTGAERQLALEKQQAASAPQNGGGAGGFDIGGLMKMFGGAMEGGEGMEGMGDIASSLGGARYGTAIPKAQNGDWYSNNPPAGATNYGQLQPVNQLKPAGSTNPLATGGIGGFDVSKLGAQGVQEENTWSKIGKGLGKQAGPIGEIIGGIGALKAEKEAAKAAKQTKLVSDVSLQAAQSTDVDARRQMQDTFSKQRRAMMQPITGENLFPVDGVGTNVLARNGRMLQGGGEIQNTYDPYDIYTDSGYEPLNDSNVKQYYYGGNIPQAKDGFANWQNSMSGGGSGFSGAGEASAGGTPWGAISQKATGLGQSLMGGQNAGGQIGGTAGKAIGSIFGPAGGAIGEFVGGIAGNALDPYAKRIKKDTEATKRNMQGMANVGMAKGIQSQNQSFMEDGGWVSNDWQPQVIASFGGLDEQEVYDYAHEGMDTLRAGGHLRDYTPPSDRAMEIYKNGGDVKSYGLGGELETHWGGGAETLSYNPYLPGTGETVMFRGKSHEEYSPNGETGIGVTYGGNPVEVERGEPMVELEEGGTVDPQTGEVQKSGVVFGNLKIPNQYIPMLGDNKAKGKKFKNYVADLSKIESKQNTLIDKSTKELNALDPKNSFDKLKLTALQASIQGANMKLKDIADKKINAASLQNAINETAEENGLVADDLARGKVKIDKEAQKQSAKFGGKFTQAQSGEKLTKENYNYLVDLYDQAKKEGKGPTVEKFQREFSRLVPEKAKEVLAQYPSTSYGKSKGLPATDPASNYDQIFGKRTKAYRASLREPIESVNELKPVGLPNDLNKKININFPVTPTSEIDQGEEDTDTTNPYILALNSLIPLIRPSDQEGLDAAQLYPEMYAMATNQLEPVQANFYRPELGVPYDISLQDQLNANQADYRAAQRTMGYNPAAQANLNAQKYQANQQVLGDQFRANQAMKDKVYGENRQILNDAKLKNLGIADQQYVRQLEALSNTKATTQAVLNSISDKYAKNKLENRTLGVMENMYNYRFDDKGRAVNMNPLVNFKEMIANANPEELEMYKSTLEGKTSKEKDKTKSAKNGSIVKSYKNL